MPAFVPRAYIPKPIVTLNANEVLVADAADVFDAVNVEDVLLELHNDIQAIPTRHKHTFVLKCTDEAAALTVSSAVYTMRLPYNFHHIQAIRASLTVAQTSGAVITIDIKRNGASIFSLPLTIANGAKSSLTATPYYAYSDYWLDDDEIVVDITQVGDGTAQGLKLYFVGLEEYEMLADDPLFGDVSLLMHFEGVAGATTLLDSSHVPASFSSAGAFQLANAGHIGVSSMLSSTAYTAPTPGYIMVDQATGFNFGTDDFCIDFWFQFTVAGTNGHIFGTVDTTGSIGSVTQLGIAIRNQAGAGLYFTFYSGTTQVTSATVGSTPLGVWKHIALTRQGSLFSLYIDGVLATTVTSALSINPARYLCFYRWHAVDTFLTYGRIDEFRVTRRHSREPYLLTDGKAPNQALDPNYDNVVLLLPMHGLTAGTTFTDKSKTPKTVTVVSGITTSRLQRAYGLSSALFNTSGRLTLASHADFAFGTGDFTIELWFRTTVASTYQYLLCTGPYSTNQFSLRINNTNQLQSYIHDGATTYGVKTGVTTIAINTWYFVQVTRAAGVTTVKMNGVVEHTSSYAHNLTSSGVLSIGDRTGVSSLPMTGNIQDVRITKGVARDSDIPIAPFPTVKPNT